MGFPIDLKKNGMSFLKFSSIQQAARYVKRKIPSNSMNQCYDIVNYSIDDKQSWNLGEDKYDFVTTEEIRKGRENRKTRIRENEVTEYLKTKNR